ncbi:MAG: IS701 family transposase [Candidatus Methylomirabilales bacterium]
MNPPKVQVLDYIQFLLAAQRVFTCTHAADCQPQQPHPPAHDAFSRLLARQPPDTAALWQEVKPLIRCREGALILDDSTLDKPYAQNMAFLTRHWSGKHHRVVWGINLISLVWTDGEALLPCDFRLYDKAVDGLDKQMHARAMLAEAHQRGFRPRMVLFDGWYASLENLKAIRGSQWHWLTRFKANRLVNPENTGNVALSTVAIPKEGRRVHLKGYGFVRVFRTVAKDGDAEYWATSELTMSEGEREEWARQAFGIEVYHRGIKQCCGIEKCQGQIEEVQRGHIQLALRAFVRLEANWLATGASWYQAKAEIVRAAIRDYLAHPWYTLPSDATA